MKLEGIPPQVTRKRWSMCLPCPVCGVRKAALLYSRPNKHEDYIRRRRVCPNGHRYTTHETALREQELAYVPDFQI